VEIDAGTTETGTVPSMLSVAVVLGALKTLDLEPAAIVEGIMLKGAVSITGASVSLKITVNFTGSAQLLLESQVLCSMIHSDGLLYSKASNCFI
jgi:hypothetical protein